MRLLYSIALALAVPFLYPFILWRRIRAFRIPGDFAARLSLTLPSAAAGGGVWLVLSSVGEAQAAASLIRGLRARWPNLPLHVSAFTPTGLEHARRLYGGEATFGPTPFDLGFIVRRVLQRLRPRLILLVEGEIWPNLLHEAVRMNVPVALVSGRLSERAFGRWRAFPGLARRVWSGLALSCMQGKADAERASALGALRPQVTGNIKFDARPEAKSGVAEKIRSLAAGRPIWVAASLRRGEEGAVFEAWRVLRQSVPDVFFVAVPRHPEQSEDAFRPLNAACRAVRWTALNNGAMPENAEALWVDAMGLLTSIYEAADAVFVGGSLLPLGGQNPIEPALVGKAIVTGPHMENFAAAVAALCKADACQTVSTPEELAERTAALLRDPARRAEMGRRAREAMESHRGAVERTLEALAPFLDGAPRKAAS